MAQGSEGYPPVRFPVLNKQGPGWEGKAMLAGRPMGCSIVLPSHRQEILWALLGLPSDSLLSNQCIFFFHPCQMPLEELKALLRHKQALHLLPNEALPTPNP